MMDECCGIGGQDIQSIACSRAVVSTMIHLENETLENRGLNV
jgi:hypothetical protein|tara:strand:- start:625 stop:750 length:126 start_codon:yes stop_codon:yes gene_type:complete